MSDDLIRPSGEAAAPHDPWADRCGAAHPTRSSTWCYEPPDHDGEHVDGDVRWAAASPGGEQR